MKAFIFAVALTCVAAVPHYSGNANSERIVDLVVENWLNERFHNLTLIDPMHRSIFAGGWHLPEGEEILSVSGYVIGVNAAGFSNLIQNSITYDLWTGDFSIDLSMPSVSGSIDSAYGEVNIFEHKLTATGAGSILATGVRAAGTAVIGLGAEGVVISNVNLEVFLGGVDANLELVVVEREIGSRITTFLNKLPEHFVNYKDQITAVLNYLVEWYINRRGDDEDSA